MSKLPTVVAVLHLVEQGRLSLSDDVAPHLPELAAQPILTGFDDATGKPKTQARTKPIRLVHLLTHSAGQAYDFLHPDMAAYQAAQGGAAPTPGTSEPIETRFAYPLLFEPGDGWVYGTGNDWAGLLLERVAGVSLEDYLRAHVLGPVGATDVTFHPERDPAVRARMWGSLPVRDAGSGKVVHTPPPPFAPAAACYGGAGLFADVTEYFKVVLSLLRNDGRILRPETVDAMFAPHLEPKAKEALIRETKNPGWIVGDIPNTGEYDWGLGGLLIDGESHPYRRKGAMMWSGAYNLTWVRFFSSPPTHSLMFLFSFLIFFPFFSVFQIICSVTRLIRLWPRSWGGRGREPLEWSCMRLCCCSGCEDEKKTLANASFLTQIIDRDAGLAAIFASNFVPPGDAKAKELMKAWEQFVYPQAKP